MALLILKTLPILSWGATLAPGPQKQLERSFGLVKFVQKLEAKHTAGAAKKEEATETKEAAPAEEEAPKPRRARRGRHVAQRERRHLFRVHSRRQVLRRDTPAVDGG